MTEYRISLDAYICFSITAENREQAIKTVKEYVDSVYDELGGLHLDVGNGGENGRVYLADQEINEDCIFDEENHSEE